MFLRLLQSGNERNHHLCGLDVLFGHRRHVDWDRVLRQRALHENRDNGGMAERNPSRNQDDTGGPNGPKTSKSSFAQLVPSSTGETQFAEIDHLLRPRSLKQARNIAQRSKHSFRCSSNARRIDNPSALIAGNYYSLFPWPRQLNCELKRNCW